MESIKLDGVPMLHTVEIQPGEVMQDLPLDFAGAFLPGEKITEGGVAIDDIGTGIVVDHSVLASTVYVDIAGPPNGQVTPVVITVTGSKGNVRKTVLQVVSVDPTTKVAPVTITPQTLNWRGEWLEGYAYNLYDLVKRDIGGHAYVFFSLATSLNKIPEDNPAAWMMWDNAGVIAVASAEAAGASAAGAAASAETAESAAANTAADRAQTGLDVLATAADREQTGLDRAAVADSAIAAATSEAEAAESAGGAAVNAAAVAAHLADSSVHLLWRGPWNGLVADYQRYDAVAYDGSSWKANTTPTPGLAPGDGNAEWDLLAAKGGQGPAGTAFGEVAFSGPSNTPNTTFFGSFNHLDPTSNASMVAGGTNQQPNSLGWQVFRQESACNGSQTDFVLNLGFTVVNNAAQVKLRVLLIRLSDGVSFPQVETTNYTVSGWGTSTLTVHFLAAPAATYKAWFRVIGDATTGNGPLLNYIINGYDSVTDGAGPMVLMNGAHHTERGNSGGHNSYLGGSYNEMFNNCSYSIIAGGSQNVLEASTFGFLAGGRNYGNGPGVVVFGQNNSVTGDYSFAAGYSHFSTKLHAAMFGRGAAPVHGGHFVIGNGKSGDTAAGLRQFGWIGMSKSTTDATEGFLSALTGDSLIILQNNSAAKVVVECVAVKSDGTDSATFSIDVLLVKTASGTPVVTGTATATMVRNTAGAAGWALRIQAAGSGFYIRPTGQAATTIRWMSGVSVVETAFSAP